MDRKWNSSVLNAGLFRGANCDTDHYLMGAKVRETPAVSKQTMYRVHIDRFNLKKLNKVG
jgi:hypothetical protein